MAISRNFGTNSGDISGAVRRPKTDPIFSESPGTGRGTHYDSMNEMRDKPLLGDNGSEFFEALTNPSGYDGSLTENGNGNTGGLSGYSSQEAESYLNAYMLMKDYPQWVALLNANPYKGLNVPDSLFDRLGLSNKQQDKMIALRQEYMNYNAQILANFMNWKNSLPSTQREQLSEAGYAADLANVGQSSLPSDIPVGSNALAMPSGSTGEELMQVVGSAASLFSTGASIALGVMQTLSTIGVNDAQRENLKKAGQGLDLNNFTSSLDTAKRIYSNLAPRLEKPKDPNEIMASFSLQYPDAPESVNKALKNYVNSREFQEGLIEADTKILDKESAFNQSYMTNEDLKVLVGSPDYWLGIRKISNKVYLEQVRKLDDYLDTLDTVTFARSQNAYIDYIMQYYDELTQLGVPGLSAQSAVSQNKAALATYDMQRSLAERNRSILEVQNQRMGEYFDVMEDPDASEWKKFWAGSFLVGNSFLTKLTDPNASNNIGVTPFSPVGFSQPSIPSFSLPITK